VTEILSEDSVAAREKKKDRGRCKLTEERKTYLNTE
jgi:hypothetical protein